MKLLRRVQPVLLAVLACLPAQAKAHAPELVLARLVFHEGPEVTLELTADVTGVPWLREAPNPAQALGAALRIALPDGRNWTVGELGKPVVSLHQGFAYAAPMPLTHSAEEPLPEMLTAAWTWRPSSSPIRFEAPEGNPASFLLWTVPVLTKNEAPSDGNGPAAPDTPIAGWQMLLAGESSTPIKLPFTPKPLSWNWKARLAMAVAAGGLALQAFLIFVRLRRRRIAYAANA